MPSFFQAVKVEEGAYGSGVYAFSEARRRGGSGRSIQVEAQYELKPACTVHLMEFQEDGVRRSCRMVVTREAGRQIGQDVRAGWNGWGQPRRVV